MPAAANKLSPFGWFCVGLGVALTFYQMLKYVGPFQWLAELQLRWFGGYGEEITFVLTFAATTGAIALVGMPLRKLMPASGGAERFLATPQSLILQVIGLGFFIAGVKDYYHAQHIGPKTAITALQLESNQTPASLWVDATGYPLIDGKYVFDAGYSKDQFVPIVSQPDGTSGGTVRLFVKAKGGDNIGGSDTNPGLYTGILAKSDLPGPVRVALQKADAISDDYYVLDLGATPSSESSGAKVSMYIGGGMAVAGTLIGVIIRLRRRPAVIAAQQQARVFCKNPL
jgi:hypothetical protein